MLASHTVLDARFKKLAAQVAASGGGGTINPLSRMAFIDSGNVSGGHTGSIAEPFDTLPTWAATIPSTTALDNAVPKAAYVTPGTYAGGVTLPAYRSTTILAATETLGGGALILHNTVAAGGVNPAAFQIVSLVDMSFTGMTVTDDATAPTTFISAAFDEAVGFAFTGNVDLSGATHVTAFELLNAGIDGDFISHADATGADLEVIGGGITGNITAKDVQSRDSELSGTAIALGAFTSSFLSTVFNQSMAITGSAGTVCNFDGASMQSFVEQGGTIGANVKAIVLGGYAGASYDGANLTNADVSVSIDGTGATAGFTQGGNHYVLPAATLNAGHILTLLTGGSEHEGDRIRITRIDATANTYTIHNGAGATIGVLPISTQGFFEAELKAGQWVMSAVGIQ